MTTSPRIIQPGIFSKHQPGDGVAGAGRLLGVGECAEVMLSPVQMDVRLIERRIPHRAYADEAAGIRATTFLIKGILLVGTDTQIAAPIVHLVAVDMIDLTIRIREQEAMKYHRAPVIMRGRIPALTEVPCMPLDQRQVDFVEQKSAAILKAGDAVTLVGHAVGIAHGLPPFLKNGQKKSSSRSMGIRIHNRES